MCGITGFFNTSGDSKMGLEAHLIAMRDCMTHRGPDDSGIWLDRDAGIALGHRRLAILDLSPAGHQPMISASGRYVLVFNGEIYNHQDLRIRLSSAFDSWRGHSDTETLLAAFECWGFVKALEATVGMFALALWDRQERKLFLARDRMGEKPLYYGWQKGVLLFGSELKALRAHPAFDCHVNRSILPLYLRYGYIPAPWSIYTRIHKLLPGTWVCVSTKDCDQVLEPRPYWSLTDVAISAKSTPFSGSEDDAVNELDRLFNQSIAGQLAADVPLGAFLSGGVDSSIVAAVMHAQSSKSVKTFTIGFEEARFNEAQYSKAVADYLGTDHSELYVTSAQALQLIPYLPKIYDEPFADSSSIPTYFVSKLASEHVTVSLSGDGGDELFGGYSRYSIFQRWHRRAADIPFPLRRLLSRGLNLLPDAENMRYRRRLAMLNGVLNSSDSFALYNSLNGHWLSTDNALKGAEEVLCLLTERTPKLHLNEPLDHALLADMLNYLPDDILVKVDRAAMSASLETRVPLLDHRIVEWSLTLPQSMKTRGGHRKWVLRELLYRYVPKNLIERPKMGFGVPIGAWLRGPLREWADDLLEPKTLLNDGFFNPVCIQNIWREHLSGVSNWEYHLWDVLMFQAWLHH